MAGAFIVDISVGAMHTLALSSTGNVYAFGDKPGVGASFSTYHTPVQVNLNGFAASAIAAGSEHSLFIINGTVVSNTLLETIF